MFLEKIVQMVRINKVELSQPLETVDIFFFEKTINTLPRLKEIRLFSVRSSHLPFKMRVDFRAFKSPLYPY